MLQKVSIQFAYPAKEKASYHWGSLLHGALIELLPDTIADMLHDRGLRPFSQYVLPLQDSRIDWNIGMWDDEIADAIIKAVMPISYIDIKHKGIRLEVLGTERKKQSERDFMARFFTGETVHRRYELEFLTPCTHKSNGEYVVFPTPELIIQSLYMRFCAFSQEISLDDTETMAQLAANIRIRGYYLHSAQYHLEGTKVNGYAGKVTLSIQGPDQLARLAGILLSFAEYSGVGIKTSLGMGGCRVTQLQHIICNKRDINENGVDTCE